METQSPMDDSTEIIGSCQYPTKLNKYGLPDELCGAPGVEYRPDRLIVRYVCARHR